MTNLMNETFSRNGLFSLPSGKEMHGTLTVDGSDSVLDLWSSVAADQYSRRKPSESQTTTIIGTLDDQKKVSLVDCMELGRTTFGGSDGYSYHERFFPHYAIVGYAPFDGEISGVSFVTDDTKTLFHDRKSFGGLHLGTEKLTKLLNDAGVSVEEGWHPVVNYWTGKTEVMSGETPLGRFFAHNQPTITAGGGPDGVHIANEVVLSIIFSDPLSVHELDDSIRKLLRFFEIVVGRPQNLLKVNIPPNYEERAVSSSVYMNMFRNRIDEYARREPDWRDILIDAASEPDKCLKLMSAWLERDEAWRVTRSRFSAGWRKQNDYDAERMVGAANMFDLLPVDVFPRCKQSLKQRARHRSSLVTKVIGTDLPDLDYVTDAAIELRHLYVHGAERNPKRPALVGSTPFLIDTLEFIFCTSDLVELGWDILSWHQKRKMGGHPFCDYLYGYSRELAELKKLYMESG